jgi:stage II sporulation protein M
MALIKCAECGQEISDMAKACPKCGFPIQNGSLSLTFSHYVRLLKDALRSNLKYAQWSAILFAFGLTLGLVIYLMLSQDTRLSIMTNIYSSIGMSSLTQMSRIEILFHIFFNNLSVCLVLIGAGIVSFRIIPFILIPLQGFIVMFMIAFTAPIMGIGFVLGNTMPHGVFEIVSIILAGAISFKLSSKEFYGGLEKKSTNIKQELYALFIFITLLLFVGAIIEYALMESMMTQFKI